MALLLIFRAFRKREVSLKCSVKQTSLKIAINELKIAKKNIASGCSEAFMKSLTSAVKNYLFAKFKYIDSAKTNSEILTKFAGDVANDWETLSLLTEILSLSDESEFAERDLSLNQRRGIYKKACRLILRVSRVIKGKSKCK
jgi:hypothetical protein